MTLTGDVIILVPVELQAHVIRAELLELDGKLDVLFRFVAGDQDVRVQHGAARLRLIFLHQVQFIKLVLLPGVASGTNDIHPVPDIGINHQTFTTLKPKINTDRTGSKSNHFISDTLQNIFIFVSLSLYIPNQNVFKYSFHTLCTRYIYQSVTSSDRCE